MTFDGRNYTDARYVYPYDYHPQAPDTGEAMGGALRMAYLHARTHRGPLFMQTTGYDMRSPGTTRGTGPIVSATTWQSVGGGRSLLPLVVTHVVGVGIYRVAEAAAATIHNRVVVYDGSGTDTGSDVQVEGPSASEVRLAQSGFLRMLRGMRSAVTPYGQGADLMVTTCEVQIENVTAGSRALTKYQQYAVRTTGGDAISIYPLLYLGWWEVRD